MPNVGVTSLLEDAEADALAYLDFPFEHHIRLHTNNVWSAVRPGRNISHGASAPAEGSAQ